IRRLIYIHFIDNIEWGNKYVIYKESLTCIMLPVFERQRFGLRRFRPKQANGRISRCHSSP
ncbi:TPA: hypothetical protein ACIVWE_001473, partial [Salmonella enterica subsp. enterica serovar Typhimurium]